MIFEEEQQDQRLKWVFSSCRNGAWGAEPDGESDVVCIRAADFDGRLGRLNGGERTVRSIDPDTYEKLALQVGDIILEKSGGGEKQLVGRAVLFEGVEPSITSNFLARCRPASGMESAFINYLLLAIYNARGTFPHLKQSTGIQNLDLGSFLDIRVHIPSLDTQQRIARFLDEKTARIDGLIEKKRALLDQLAEKRQVLISRAVTKGLNPDAPMKPSGIDWLGDIPKHWEVKRLSFIADVIDCKHRTPEYIEDGVPLVSTSEIKPFAIDYSTKRRVSDEEFELMSEGGRAPIPGDVIYSRNASVGSAALVRDDRALCLGQDLCIIRPRHSNSEFMEYFLNSGACLEQLSRALVGATFKRVNVDVIKKYFSLQPSADEQLEIGSWLNAQLRAELKNAETVSRSLELLAEYRVATITAAVTGQIAELR